MVIMNLSIIDSRYWHFTVVIFLGIQENVSFEVLSSEKAFGCEPETC